MSKRAIAERLKKSQLVRLKIDFKEIVVTLSKKTEVGAYLAYVSKWLLTVIQACKKSEVIEGIFRQTRSGVRSILSVCEQAGYLIATQKNAF